MWNQTFVYCLMFLILPEVLTEGALSIMQRAWLPQGKRQKIKAERTDKEPTGEEEGRNCQTHRLIHYVREAGTEQSVGLSGWIYKDMERKCLLCTL